MRSRKSSSNWGAHSPEGSIWAKPGTLARIAASKSHLAFRIAHTSRWFTCYHASGGNGLRGPHSIEQNHDTAAGSPQPHNEAGAEAQVYGASAPARPISSYLRLQLSPNKTSPPF